VLSCSVDLAVVHLDGLLTEVLEEKRVREVTVTEKKGKVKERKETLSNPICLMTLIYHHFAVSSSSPVS
jgi:hypothetical protein